MPKITSALSSIIHFLRLLLLFDNLGDFDKGHFGVGVYDSGDLDLGNFDLTPEEYLLK